MTNETPPLTAAELEQADEGETMNPTKKMYRQGDVLIIRATKKGALTKEHQKVARDAGRVVLAYGEVTGHAHALHEPGVALLRREGISDRVLTVGRELAELVHEEHATIALPKGTYVIRQQREYDCLAEASRAVAD